jgi:RNA polymerase sigma-70 factor, ECF subfamily
LGPFLAQNLKTMSYGAGDLEPSISTSQLTSASLLAGVRLRDAESWRRMAKLYAPLVRYWCRKAGLADDAADDLIQETFAAVLRGLPKFERRPDGGSFRGWLRTITRNKLIDYFRGRRDNAAAAGGTEAYLNLGKLADPLADDIAAGVLDDAGPADTREATETGLVFRAAVDLIRTEFEPVTQQAFWATTVEERPPAEVAAQLGITLNAVYKAKSRVLRRLREVLEGLEA